MANSLKPTHRPSLIRKQAWRKTERERYFDRLRTELARRQERAKGLIAYHDKPVEFVHEVIGDFLWSKQVEIMRALTVHRKVAVASAHGIGKSFLAARVVTWFIATSPLGMAKAITTAPTGDQVTGILWQEIHAAHSRGRLPGKPRHTEWWLQNYQLAVGRKPSDYSPTAFQGYHAERLLVVIDEACGVPELIWTAADSLATTEGSRMLAIGNPDDPASYFAQMCKPGTGWHVIHVSAFDSPNFTDEEVPDHIRDMLTSKAWVEDKRRIWGEESPLWQSKVLGQFPDVGDDTLIPPGWVRKAIDRWSEMEEGEQIELGCDIARFGSNETVIMLRRGYKAEIYKVLHQRDLMHVTGEIVRAVRETGATVVKVDDSGLGGGVTDRLNELVAQHEFGDHAVYIMPINVGVGASDRHDRDSDERGTSDRFLNLRAELFWKLRGLFEDDLIAIPDDDDLAGQLVSIKYSMTSRGQIQLESKEQMRKRSIPSPDRADALMLCFAETQPASLRAWAGML
jgi:hypothetical protein